ncbi:uroporphyrinogen-III synthase [Mangrovibacterium lignilyticum]|uniref:uroporphyrinogen-III synthase n=1 Tax=Mangrovibacterium lignilyticum TaxID=2668052 RepID=UPI0013D2AC98|nr:uroporphyrinogen-III synthase [Mangrovibacterium lignilyticum]
MELPSVFIGRSLSEKTRQWLKSQPVRFIEQPLFRIQFRKPKVEFLASVRDEKVSLVVTSSYAAHWLARFRHHFGLRSQHEVFCLSSKQEAILKKTRMKIHRSKEPNIFSLSELIASQNTGQKVVYLRGNKPLNDLYEQLFSHGIRPVELEVYKNTPIEKWLNQTFDAYLFFNPNSIETYKASGNFPAPKGQIMAVGDSTAMMAWKVFPNEVNVSREQEELSFVQFSIDRLQKKLSEPEFKGMVTD